MHKWFLMTRKCTLLIGMVLLSGYLLKESQESQVLENGTKHLEFMLPYILSIILIGLLKSGNIFM